MTSPLAMKLIVTNAAQAAGGKDFFESLLAGNNDASAQKRTAALSEAQKLNDALLTQKRANADAMQTGGFGR